MRVWGHKDTVLVLIYFFLIFDFENSYVLLLCCSYSLFYIGVFFIVPSYQIIYIGTVMHALANLSLWICFTIFYSLNMCLIIPDLHLERFG